uniref:DUF7036 domain-containing protein n=1 Tax=Kalanchoe fedtschenkoi TaxID=63787 RepID=A0A7N0V3X4_KALFE
MGKAEDGQHLPSSSAATGTGDELENEHANRCSGVSTFVRLKCAFVVILSLGLLLSAVFWLPPFLHYGDQQEDLDLNSQFRGHDIVARFKVKKPFSSLEGNIPQLEEDILAEIDYSYIKVVILALDYSAGTNITEVVFAVDPVTKDTKLSSTTLSLIRDSFVYMVIEPSYLRLTASLFGNPYAFEVLKFPEGITVIPSKGVYLLQKVQIYFNFTLNFSISQIQDNFDDLTTQLKSGLHLSPYENLYIRLTNYQGSTISPPTTVQTSVVMAVGYNPSMPRLKQLAQTITGSHSKNLGLNNTVFGKVKQVRLSSILQHSLHGGDGSPSPSPAPIPQPRRHSHYQNQHQHQHHSDLAPSPAVHGIGPSKQRGTSAPHIGGSPAPSPAPAIHKVKPPSCEGGNKQLPKAKNSHITPIAAPTMSPQIPLAPRHHRKDPPRYVSKPVPVSSPLPSVVFPSVHPPSEGERMPPHTAPSLPHSGTSSRCLFPLFMLLVLVLHL